MTIKIPHTQGKKEYPDFSELLLMKLKYLPYIMLGMSGQKGSPLDLSLKLFRKELKIEQKSPWCQGNKSICSLFLASNTLLLASYQSITS